MSNQRIHPEGLFPDVQFGFSHVATSVGQKTIHVAGQVAWDAEMNIIEPGDLRGQMKQAFKNITCALASSGAGPKDVVRKRTYVVNYSTDDVETIGLETSAFYAPGEPPPNILIGVQALAMPEFMVEIEVTAVVD